MTQRNRFYGGAADMRKLASAVSRDDGGRQRRREQRGAAHVLFAAGVGDVAASSECFADTGERYLSMEGLF